MKSTRSIIGQGRSVQARISGDQSRTTKFPRSSIPTVPAVKPLTLFESGAILMYLAEKTGKFLPQDMRQALRSDSVADVSDGRSRADVRPGELFLPSRRKSSLRHRALSQRSDAPLQSAGSSNSGQREYLAGEYSIADIATYPWVWRHEVHHVKLEEFPNVKRWYRCDFGIGRRLSAGWPFRKFNMGEAVIPNECEESACKNSRRRQSRISPFGQMTTCRDLAES